MELMLPAMPTEKRESVSLIARRVQPGSSIFGAGTDFTESRLPAPAPSGVVFFAFDGGIISDAVTAVYCEYAETSLLEAFFETVKRVGDWRRIQQPAGIMGCHGDLRFDRRWT